MYNVLVWNNSNYAVAPKNMVNDLDGVPLQLKTCNLLKSLPLPRRYSSYAINLVLRINTFYFIHLQTSFNSPSVLINICLIVNFA